MFSRNIPKLYHSQYYVSACKLWKAGLSSQRASASSQSVFPLRKFYTEQTFVLLCTKCIRLRNHADTQPVKRFKGYAFKFRMLEVHENEIALRKLSGSTAHLHTLEETLLTINICIVTMDICIITYEFWLMRNSFNPASRWEMRLDDEWKQVLIENSEIFL